MSSIEIEGECHAGNHCRLRSIVVIGNFAGRSHQNLDCKVPRRW